MQSLEVPPVMLTQEEFLKEVRKINPLVSLEHCRHLGLQLQVCIFTIKIFVIYNFNYINYMLYFICIIFRI